MRRMNRRRYAPQRESYTALIPLERKRSVVDVAVNEWLTGLPIRPKTLGLRIDFAHAIKFGQFPHADLPRRCRMPGPSEP